MEPDSHFANRQKKPKPSPRQPDKGARVMWRVRGEESESCSELYQDEYAAANAVACAEEHDLAASMERVLVLPLSPEARERRAHAISVLIYRQFHGVKPHPEYERGYIENARQILASLGDGEQEGKQ